MNINIDINKYRYEPNIDMNLIKIPKDCIKTGFINILIGISNGGSYLITPMNGEH